MRSRARSWRISTLALRDTLGITMLLVTHDIDEAVYLSDRVFVLSPPPSVVVRSFDIPLGRGRDQERTRSDARFLELRNAIHQLIGRPRPVSAPPAQELLR